MEFLEYTHKGDITMEPLLIANWILFIAVTAYAIYLFIYLLKSRYDFIKLGKKVEFEENFNERLRKVMVMFLDKRN